MKTPNEIQRAHDLLVPVILREIDLGYTDKEIESIATFAAVLCWVLEHDHMRKFPEFLQGLERAANQAGYELEPLP